MRDLTPKNKYEDFAFQAYGAYFEVRSWDVAIGDWILRRHVWYERDNPIGTRECEFTPP
jgi:hypothetical protein